MPVIGVRKCNFIYQWFVICGKSIQFNVGREYIYWMNRFEQLLAEKIRDRLFGFFVHSNTTDTLPNQIEI